jgi:hypothetical protein
VVAHGTGHHRGCGTQLVVTLPNPEIMRELLADDVTKKLATAPDACPLAGTYKGKGTVSYRFTTDSVDK